MAQHQTVYHPYGLRDAWPDPLASQWFEGYPQLFDSDDLRRAWKGRQRNLHFNEWFLAIHLYYELGVLSLVEKYQFSKAHPKKATIVLQLMSGKDRDRMVSIWDACSVQAPDLLVCQPDYSRFWFAEAKGPHEPIPEKQLRSHTRLKQAFGVAVEIYRICEGAAQREGQGV